MKVPLIAVALEAVGIAAVGCGGGTQVVTVTQPVTETVITEGAKVPLTQDDRTWMTLIRTHDAAIERILSKLRAAGQSVGAGQVWSDATVELVALRGELDQMGIVGVSPCMQRVAVDWESAFSSFEEAFGGAMGGLRGQLTDDASAQVARWAVKSELAKCLATVEAPASTTPEDVSASPSDVQAAMAWLDSPPDGNGMAGAATKRALRENMKLAPGSVHVTCNKRAGDYSAVVITGNDKIAASEESGGGFQETSVAVALNGDQVVYVTGGNFLWSPAGSGDLPGQARDALALCGRS